MTLDRGEGSERKWFTIHKHRGQLGYTIKKGKAHHQ